MKKLLLLAMTTCMALFVSCSKDDDSSGSTNNGGYGSVEYSITYDISDITATSVNYYIYVSLSNYDKLEGIGVCWSTEDNPTISTGSYMMTENEISYTFTIENLTPNTHYYINGFFKYDSLYYYYLGEFTTLGE